MQFRHARPSIITERMVHRLLIWSPYPAVVVKTKFSIDFAQIPPCNDRDMWRFESLHPVASTVGHAPLNVLPSDTPPSYLYMCFNILFWQFWKWLRTSDYVLSKSDAVPKCLAGLWELRHCVIAIYYVFYSTVYNLSLSVFLLCWWINVFISKVLLLATLVHMAALYPFSRFSARHWLTPRIPGLVHHGGVPVYSQAFVNNNNNNNNNKALIS